MATTIKFSVIIPVYNVAPYLRECLGSIAAAIEQCRSKSVECRTEVEVICVDDGSTDGSSEILDSYLQLQLPTTTIKVIHQTNQGVSAARNRGLAEARGDYVGFVDGDDFVEEDWFLKASDLILRTEPDLLRFCFKAKSSLVINANDGECEIIEGKESVSQWGWKTFTRGGWSVLVFVRRSCLPPNPFPVDLRICEDNIFSLRLLPTVSRVCRSDYAGYIYRRREGSAVFRKVSTDEAAGVISLFTVVVKEQRPNAKDASVFVRNMRDWWGRTFVLGDPIKGLAVALSSAKMAGGYDGVCSRVALIALIAVEYLKRLKRRIVGR